MGVELGDVCDPIAGVGVAIFCARAVIVFIYRGNPDWKDVRKRKRGR